MKVIMGMFMLPLKQTKVQEKTIVRSLFKGIFVVFFFKKVSGDTPVNQKKTFVAFFER